MKYYKDSSNNLYAFNDDGFQDHLIKDTYVLITQQDIIDINAAKQQAAFDALTYAEKRATEYPDFKDYLDGIVKGDEAQVQAYIDACKAVKAKYPKQ